ncbi:hypothetical protein J3R83DRAFT_13684 [Lanmaoa asiatica]|nr:hypothetical protein J3R83DRAFT_13684 [Lanmaoa asiatica]
MARKKKARFTHKKKLENKETHDGMSAQKFDTFAQEYGSFIVEDSDHELQTFSQGDVAYIQYREPEDDVVVPEEEYWIGQIQEIRADRPDDNISNPLAHVDLKQFDETSIYQVSIGEAEWFARYNFLYIGKRISPKVTHVACPICKVPYTPGVEKILHFCPRPSCRNFYHQSCLVKHGYTEETRTHRVLETWPHIDRTESMEQICCIYPPRKRQKKDHSASKGSGNDLLAGLPAQLIAVAEQQIVRGTRGGGVVGNIAPVVAARQLIYGTLNGGGVIPDGWETMIDTSAAFPEIGTILPNCTCPSCYSPI